MIGRSGIRSSPISQKEQFAGGGLAEAGPDEQAGDGGDAAEDERKKEASNAVSHDFDYRTIDGCRYLIVFSLNLAQRTRDFHGLMEIEV